ncbi:MAG: AbrB/MazE/SpoVT family DNA-binding domain-containing protein [Acidiferrobacterales bacterium]
MLATVTDKGQVTVPKALRDKMGIVPGSKLDFELTEQGALHVRVLARGADNLFGLVHRPHQAPLDVAAMDEGIAAAVASRNRPA